MAKTIEVAAKTFKMKKMAEATPWQFDKTMVERYDYLLTTGLWADCTFVVGAETHQVLGHKLILAMASPVFEAMFYGGLSEGHKIFIPDIEPDTFRTLFEYIYTGQTHICSFNLAWELWYAAKKYQLPHLVDKCKNYIHSVVDHKNACRAYEMARFFEDQSIMDLCIKKIRTNPKEALNDKSFEEVEIITVIALCSLDPINVDNELDLFDAVARYAQAQEMTQVQRICPSLDVGGPTVGIPSEKLSMGPESDKPKEKMVNGEREVIKSSAQNGGSPVAVEQNLKSDVDDTEEKSELVINKKHFQEGKPNIRTAIQKIRFLSLTPQQFADGPARSGFLTEAESYAIFMNINSKVGEVPMPTGFSNCRVRRKPFGSSSTAATPTTSKTGRPCNCCNHTV